MRHFKNQSLKRSTDILTISSRNEIPTIDEILERPRKRTLKIVFKGSVQDEREVIGRDLKGKLPNFQIGVHIIEPEINIAKLITDQEIAENQLFFEQCAKDYRKLGAQLISDLANTLDIIIDKDFPLDSFNQFKRSNKQQGRLNEWRYFFHGIHCLFENSRTHQSIEVCLLFGLEFGALDPYFFSRFIKSTPEYKPLPIEIYEDYADGVRILDRMLELGKFERIYSNTGNDIGIVVTDREKFSNHTLPEEVKNSTRPKFSLWKLLGLR